MEPVSDSVLVSVVVSELVGVSEVQRMPLNFLGIGAGGGCGVGLGLGWGFGAGFGSKYRSSRVVFQGVEFNKKSEHEGAQSS
ncbi:hypothetical protein Tco_0606393 [Tanacetum coccineum]